MFHLFSFTSKLIILASLCFVSINLTENLNKINSLNKNKVLLNSHLSVLEIITKPTNLTEIKVDDHSTNLKLSKEMLGRITWTYLHSVAAAYPLQPTHEEQLAVKDLFNSL